MFLKLKMIPYTSFASSSNGSPVGPSSSTGGFPLARSHGGTTAGNGAGGEVELGRYTFGSVVGLVRGVLPA